MANLEVRTRQFGQRWTVGDDKIAFRYFKMVTTKHCSYGRCKNDSRKPDGLTMTNRYGQRVFFIKFPGKKRKVEKCKRWVNACLIEEGHKKIAYETLTYDHYICSLHFVGENGPTESHPDPVPANLPAEKRAELENTFKKQMADLLASYAAKELASLQQERSDLRQLQVIDASNIRTLQGNFCQSSASYVEMEIAQVLVNLSETAYM